jgi:hypothetical protein
MADGAMIAQFTDARAIVTEELKLQDSYGSALFTAQDGTEFAIAQWPNVQTWQNSSGKRGAAAVYEAMIDAFAEGLGEQVLDEWINLWTG